MRISIEEIKEYAKDYSCVPLTEELPMNYTPVGIVKKIRTEYSHCFMLESREDPGRMGRYTFIGFDPEAEITCKNFHIRISDENGVREIDGNPEKYIGEMLSRYRAPKLEGLPAFSGGLVGYFGYDYVKYSEKTLDLDAEDDGNFKDVDLMLFDKLIAFDNFEEKMIIIVNIMTDNPEKNYYEGIEEIKRIRKFIDTAPVEEPKPLKLKTGFTPLFDGAEYAEMVEKAKRYIREGDIFQVVLSNRLEAEAEGSLFRAYEILRHINPSPYMFWFSSDDIEIAGASPETLVKLENKTLFTYPLAGTRPRGKTAAEDDALEKELLDDEKELAEHNMLVDLGRNDLGKISKFGSVKVESFHNILKFSHVMHIGSTVTGTIRDDRSALDALNSVLPAGTLSGAPKIRAMQIINELENNKRGIYGGAIGYIDFTGNLDTCISIRLAYKKKGKVYVRSGAGIVADSDPEKEHRECINKAMAVVKAVEQSAGEDENGFTD
jgi:anthranilate synthase component 1